MSSFTVFRRGHKWFVRYYIPKSLQPLVGKTEVVRTLKTNDHREAKQLAPSVVAHIQRKLGTVERAPEVSLPTSDPRSVLQEALRLRSLVEAGLLRSEGDPRSGALGADDLIDMAADAHLETYPDYADSADDVGFLQLSSEVSSLLGSAYRTATDPTYKPLKEWIDAYLAAKKDTIRVGTHDAKKRNLSDLSRAVGGLRDPRSITRKELNGYVETGLMRGGRKAKTVKDDISNIRAFFGWLQDREVIDANPSDRLMRMVPEDRRGKASVRRPWSRAELTTLLASSGADPRLHVTACLAIYTGMRLEEICALRVEDSEDDRLRIMEGKSKAAVRAVPLHPILKPLITELRQSSRDGYLIPKLLPGGLDNKRGHYLSKRFGDWRKDALAEAVGITFHSLRNTFMTACENEGAPKDSVKLIVGHSRSDITYGLYSTGPEFQKLADMVARVNYGDEVDALAAELLASLPTRLARVKAPSRRPKLKAS